MSFQELHRIPSPFPSPHHPSHCPPFYPQRATMATPTPTPTPQAPLTPDQRLALEQKTRYDRLTRNLAIGGAIACPVIMLLPPRKLDLYTFSLSIGFYLSADHLSESYSGRPLYQHVIPRAIPGTGLPTEKAEETARLLRERREREEMERVRREGLEGLKREEDRMPFWRRVWMGGEKEGWKDKRMEEERRALEEGKSYTDIIFGQIWEVWNWDKKE
ncbi:hypothetical protein P280DRAFT_222893 [Massarina eburnea CBS 473.64]|uniref:Uncharacterized protein n=1 Tax=Massarina eburnea CBS 473.64 TaxID=1395130 RepID=A0A6A6S8T8_9PLEO|nr:hypothetical protein P280DRAFT_222893 [Massarina eburnea CBS 473.64]